MFLTIEQVVLRVTKKSRLTSQKFNEPLEQYTRKPTAVSFIVGFSRFAISVPSALRISCP
jgi:hypothetical protein